MPVQSKLQAVGDWRERQALPQLRTGSSWLAVETGRHEDSDRVDRVRQRCSSSVVDDVDHMDFDCAALEIQWWNYPSLFIQETRCLSDFMTLDVKEVRVLLIIAKKACTAEGGG